MDCQLQVRNTDVVLSTVQQNLSLKDAHRGDKSFNMGIQTITITH